MIDSKGAHVDPNPAKPFRQLFGFAISAKRYALYTRSQRDIKVEKASGHGLGYLFAPKARKRGDEQEDDQTPEWIFEAWDFLLRKALGLRSQEPGWLDLPAMMRMVLTTPNVLKNRRPEWLSPFGFFLFPLISELGGGYPTGFDRSNFVTDRRWEQGENPSMLEPSIDPFGFRQVANNIMR